ncbi:MAG: hypothetical protein AAB389_03845 [Patescibacteria group bacterium]
MKAVLRILRKLREQNRRKDLPAHLPSKDLAMKTLRRCQEALKNIGKKPKK